MNRNRFGIFARLAIVLALLVAMTGTAFAHRFDPPLAPALQAFLQAGGTLDDLCSDTHSGHTKANKTCDACHLVGTAILPHVTGFITQPMRVPVRLANAPVQSLHHVILADPSRPVRAPPVI